jgi:hypothetical protein
MVNHEKIICGRAMLTKAMLSCQMVIKMQILRYIHNSDGVLDILLFVKHTHIYIYIHMNVDV